MCQPGRDMSREMIALGLIEDSFLPLPSLDAHPKGMIKPPMKDGLVLRTVLMSRLAIDAPGTEPEGIATPLLAPPQPGCPALPR
jgi:hypothetical protein